MEPITVVGPAGVPAGAPAGAVEVEGVPGVFGVLGPVGGASELPVPADAPSVPTGTPSEPVVAEPVVAEPVVAEPVVAEPVVAEPVVAEPVGAGSVAGWMVIGLCAGDEPLGVGWRAPLAVPHAARPRAAATTMLPVISCRRRRSERSERFGEAG
ncbi:hypothetical protein [Kitasatospora aureofaciens]|uniref:hypothetical protein n=1 Tax=Kitasatospora aureofaciens TaxID=1894 RepID=UPI003814E705